MTVSFNNIPSGLRVPFFYVELDNSKANSYSQNLRALLIGQKTTAGTAAADIPVLVSTADQARAMFGADSMLAAMVEQFRAGNIFTELWCAPVAEPAGGAASVQTLTFTGTATETKTMAVYVGATRLQVTVNSGDTAAVVATAVAAAITANTRLPVSASAAAGVVTITSKFKGIASNGFGISLNRRGVSGGEQLPAGITVGALAVTTAGSGSPSLAGVIAALGDEEYDFIGTAFADATSLDALKAEMNETTGRWSYSRQIYGHVYTAMRGTLGALQAFGVTRNDQHATVFGLEPGLGFTDYEYVGARLAREATLLSAMVSRPTQTGEVVGALATLSNQRFIFTERQTLLSSGIATHYSGKDGVVRIERSITTYQKNAWGSSDVSYLDSENLHQLAYVMRDLRTAVTSKFGRMGLRADGLRVPEGVCTPSMIRGELIARYGAMERLGIVENTELFAANLVVEIDATNPNRVNVLYPPDLVNQLRIFAVLNQFRLNY